MGRLCLYIYTDIISLTSLIYLKTINSSNKSLNSITWYTLFNKRRYILKTTFLFLKI